MFVRQLPSLKTVLTPRGGGVVLLEEDEWVSSTVTGAAVGKRGATLF